MAFRKILTVLDGGSGEAAALETAFALARPVGGHVVGLFVRNDPRESIPLLGEGVSGPLVEQIMDAAQTETADRAAAARRVFEGVRARFGAETATAPGGPPGATAQWLERVGRAEEEAVAAARLADVCVLPRPRGDLLESQMLLLEAVLMGSGRPVLMAPHQAPGTVGRHVVIAWNGTTESTRAVGFAMPLIATAESVHIVSAETGKTPSTAGQALAELLGWHGVRPAVQTLSPQGEPVGAALLRMAGSVGADLLVMGGYGHSRLREMILGGVTVHVLGHAELPVLLAH